MTGTAERERFVSFIRERGLRVTSERLALLDQIFDHHGHIDAEQLLASLRADGVKISRATVYRNLDLLVECGLVHKQRLGRNRYLYEHLHAGQRHDHLVCAECGRVVEFISPGIAALQTEICRAHGFVPSEHALQITGLCKACAETGAESSEPRPRAAAGGSR